MFVIPDVSISACDRYSLGKKSPCTWPSCFSAAIIMSGWIFFLPCLSHGYNCFFLVFFWFIHSLSCCHSRWSRNTSAAPQENPLTCSHVCHNKQGSAGCEQGAEEEGFNSGLPAGVCSTQTSCCHPLQSTWTRRSHYSKKYIYICIYIWESTHRNK